MQVNPARFTHKRQVPFASVAVSAPPGALEEFVDKEQGTLSFELTIDGTGIIDKERTDVFEEIAQLQTILYTHTGQIHPNYVQISWGRFLFKGVLLEMTVNYVLFKPDGLLLRVTVFLSFSGFTDV
ncbi:hypothetical protein LC612_42935 [Nostoc sp. CHAB 5834]|nr:hypothetical protein [Nostoc sp. CHAB 5834]